MIAPRICAIVTVGDRIGLLRPFLAHYRRLGVARFIFNYELQDDAGLIDAVSSIARELGCDHVTGTVHRGQHYSRVQFANARRSWMKHCTPHDWVLYPDLDEFFEIPRGLPGLLTGLDAVDLVTGEIVDRIAADGALLAITPGMLLEDTFPLGVHVTRDIVKAPVRNVAIARGFSPISKHVELCETSQGKRAANLTIRVHHFKWNDTVMTTIEQRKRRYKSKGYPWWVESAATLEHLESNGGRFDVDNLEGQHLGRVLGV